MNLFPIVFGCQFASNERAFYYASRLPTWKVLRVHLAI
jgi:hypothetical protein